MFGLWEETIDNEKIAHRRWVQLGFVGVAAIMVFGTLLCIYVIKASVDKNQ